MIYKNEAETAKNGSLVPVFMNGKLMHSKYNPQNEALQFAKSAERADLFIILGLGGGYHIEALLNIYPNAKFIVAENSDEDIQNLLEIPCVKALSDRITLCTKETLSKTILSLYNPILFEKLSIISQRAWAQNYPEIDAAFRAIIDATLKNISADYSVQAHFGRHWHRNILMNLKYLSKNANVFPFPITKQAMTKTAAIIAAGPSLDESAEKIKKEREKYFVIATDTAFSALTKRGISSDVVISIDAQNVSYKHFLCSTESEKKSLCVFDLSSPPSSVRKVEALGYPIFFAISKHPLAQLASQFFPFMTLESGAGTVTIAAADFARQLGFEKIELFGADFAYSRGKAYTKGTYLDSIYRQNEKRINNAETEFCALMYRTELTEKEKRVFTTPMLESYASTTEYFFSSHGFEKIGDNLYKSQTAFEKKSNYDSEKKFPFAEFREYLLKEKESQNALFAHLPAMAAIKAKQMKNNSIFMLLKLAYSATVRYTN